MAFGIAYRAIAASSDLLIVHHQYFRQVLAQSYGIQSSKVVVIPHGAPDANGAHHRDANPSRRRILILGFLAGYKLPEILVEVAKMDAVPNATFDFCVGANPRIRDRAYLRRYGELERQVRGLGSRAIWHGYIPEDSLAATIDQADVVVLPYAECVSVGGVAALAQRSRTPICYSRPLRPLFGPGPLEFELDGPALADAIIRSFSAGATPLVSGFASWTDAARATEAVWSRLLTLR
jgi:glycosyltransferase involved in cell wall biosynthesis